MGWKGGVVYEFIDIFLSSCHSLILSIPPPSFTNLRIGASKTYQILSRPTSKLHKSGHLLSCSCASAPYLVFFPFLPPHLFETYQYFEVLEMQDTCILVYLICLLCTSSIKKKSCVPTKYIIHDNNIMF